MDELLVHIIIVAVGFPTFLFFTKQLRDELICFGYSIEETSLAKIWLIQYKIKNKDVKKAFFRYYFKLVFLGMVVLLFRFFLLRL